jgi:FkbM family methyltransferase
MISIVRRALKFYIRTSPLERGKFHLIRKANLLHQSNSPELITEVHKGIWMELNLHSLIEREIYYSGFYRRWVLDFFDGMLKNGQKVFDIGANVGPFTLWAAKRVGKEGCVVAFEPEKTCYEKLVKNIQLNNFDWVRTENVAVTDFDGTAYLYLNDVLDENQGQSSLSYQSAHHAFARKISCIRLDSYISQGKISAIDILKIDTQGAEMRVLDGAMRAIDDFRPNVLFRCHEDKTQLFGDSTVGIQGFFLDRDYELFEIRASLKEPIQISEPRSSSDGTFIALSN